jgi:hypothetical protein
MSSSKPCFAAWAALLTLLFCLPTLAQGPSDTTAQAQTPDAPAPQTAASADDGWHFAVSPYLWFPGMSGTVGVLGHNASVHASPGDILSNFHIGLMGAVEARKNRFVFPLDLIWVKLEADRGLPVDQGLTSVQVKVTETILAPKVGYRIVDREKIKVDGLVGIRYWHLSQNLSFQPSGILSNRSPSANWVDVVAGGKIEMALSEKALITVLGDAGGGGANSDYQVAGLLGYRVGKKCILQAGWRYLDVNYRNSPPTLFVYDAHQSGALLGVTFNLK